MDKLEPLIRHRFWILFAISLPLAMTGYFMANSEMQAATEKKEKELEGVLANVPKGTTEPNQEFADGLQAINEDLQQENYVEIQKLWEAQQERMDWPEIMLRYLPDTHRGEVDRSGRIQYVQEYPGILNRLWKRVQPVVSKPRPLGLTVDWPEKVLLMPDTIPTAPFHRHASISSEEMWDAQEDIWMMEVIFDAIVRTNEGASYVGDAPVRRIDQLYLTGGSGESSVASQAAAGGGGGGGFGGGGAFDGARFADDDDDDDKGGGSRRSRSGSAAGGPRGAGSSSGIGFDIAEEIGPEVPPAGVAGAAATPAARTDGFRQRDEDDDDGGGRSRGGSLPERPPSMFRYIGKPEQVKNEPYHERAFYMSVIVMLPELPNFLTEMASSEWPIRIGRFHVGPNPYGTDTSGSLTSRRNTRGTRARRVADTDDDEGPSFGGGGAFGRSLSRARAGRSPSFAGRGGGGFSGSLVLPPTMVGPYEIDPNWFASPDLVQLDFYGVITMYKPITNDAITKKSDGTTEAESLKEIEETEAAAKVAEEAAALEQTTETLDPGTPGTAEEPSPVDGAEPDSEPADESDANATDPVPPDESPSEETSSRDTAPEE